MRFNYVVGCSSTCLVVIAEYYSIFQKKSVYSILNIDGQSNYANYAYCQYWAVFVYLLVHRCMNCCQLYIQATILALTTCAASTVVKSVKLFSHTSSYVSSLGYTPLPTFDAHQTSKCNDSGKCCRGVSHYRFNFHFPSY